MDKANVARKKLASVCFLWAFPLLLWCPASAALLPGLA